MTKKPLSWAQSGLLFLWMVACTFGLTMAFSSAMRHQAGSIHSLFWQFAFPSDVAGSAIFVIAARFIMSWGLTRQKQCNLETHQSS